MLKKKEEAFNLKEFASVIKYFFDNTGVYLVRKDETTKTGFSTPREITLEYSLQLMKHIQSEIRKALLSGVKVRLPDIGSIFKKDDYQRNFKSIETGQIEKRHVVGRLKIVTHLQSFYKKDEK